MTRSYLTENAKKELNKIRLYVPIVKHQGKKGLKFSDIAIFLAKGFKK